MFSVYVGKYPSPKISKKDLKKLNELGLVGYLFAMEDCYSLKVKSFPREINAQQLKNALTQREFNAFIKEE